ncbi:MAG: hypothetical protein KJ905_03070 [Nanoarchaeota archaeon]|nr:hypothetical protein [Nanoarchaeota archaeon]MBU1501730.1 hypothetical protein [Nanoarchaeota archaeon]MBU2459258.1 hypothetical protein [Nanoarchaeota archaeon]
MSDIKFEVIKKIAETRFKYKDFGKISELDTNSPPSVFIGSKLKYPNVNVGILSPVERDENAWVYDDAKYWAGENFSIREVISLRDSLLNSRFRSKVTDSRSSSGDSSRFVKIAQEIALASKPVDVEIELRNKVGPGLQKDRVLMPQGMRGDLKKAKIVGNVKIDKKLDKVINDELKASEGIKYLYKNKFDEYTLSKILSVGVLGLKKDKKLVPTRWSITATDDMIGKNFLERIRGYKWIEDYELFLGEFMGNCYLIMLFPNVFSYELFELYLPGSSWNPGNEIKASTDMEGFHGRKTYASATAGGYYASRLPILEYLDGIKKQASVLAIRIELPSYWASLGVWVVRESVRKALANKNLKFTEMSELVESARKIGMIKFGFDPEKIIKKSKVLETIKTQTNLWKWV